MHDDMLVRKFYAETSREALLMVRQALGEDALILSNRAMGRGVEIMAASPAEVQSVTISALRQPDPRKPAEPAPAVFRRASTVRGPVRDPVRDPAQVPPVVRSDPRFMRPAPPGPSTPMPGASAVARYDEVLKASTAISSDPGDGAAHVHLGSPPSGAALRVEAGAALARPAAPSPAPGVADSPVAAAVAAAEAAAAAGGMSYDLVHELRLLRSLVEGQLAALAWNDLKRRDPARSEMMRRLLGAGFGSPLSRELVDELPEGLDVAPALRLVKTRLQQRLRVASGGAGLVDAGGILALVGPTGVGKTTTVAKLAAECVLKHGAAKLALVTTDTYRIGAVDQLRIYGKILGVPVYAIRNEGDLRSTLEDLRSRHLVLIDTVGMSQRDRRLADQVALLSGATRRVQRVVLLSAVSHLNVLEDVVRAYRGADLAGCILTKIDEALNLGTALDALIRHGLTLHYVTNGQRVPEDLHLPNPLYLVERAFREGPQQVDDGDLPFTLAAGQN
ncbi:MAG: flagellar biosynthesis protein FlhF [Burkholderiales bacterium]|nr:flagellar biosynthesis protein FlhF [Burkholderiales bacterium]